MMSPAEALYDAYPRKIARAKALKTIKRALQKQPFEFLLDRVRLFALSDAGKAGVYVPYPATWFGQERFNDDPSEWNKNNRAGFRAAAQADDFAALEKRSE